MSDQGAASYWDIELALAQYIKSWLPTSMIPPITHGIYEIAHVYPVPSLVPYNMAAEARIKMKPHSGLTMLNKALSAGVKPKPTTIRGSCCEVLLGSSLKNR